VVSPIYEGEPVTENRLSPKGSGGGLAATIPPGMRACAVRVNEVVGVAGFVVPGMRVDVLITGLPPGGNAARRTQGTDAAAGYSGPFRRHEFPERSGGKPEQAQVVNLLVTPAQAEILSLASNETHIQLVLRNPMDTQISKPPGTMMSSLFGGASAPAPVSPDRPQSAQPANVRRWQSVPAPDPARSQSVYHRSVERRRAHPSQVQPARSEALRAGRWYGVAAMPAACLLALSFVNTLAANRSGPATPHPSPAQSGHRVADSDLTLTVGKSMIVDSALPLERISVGFGDVAEATAISPRELLLNGKTPGVTSLIVWQQGGSQAVFRYHGGGQPLLADRRIEAIKG
jgi:Flp pilus assembly protein CpaB